MNGSQRRVPSRNQSLRAGFTLLELLVVVIMIAILASLIFPAINNARRVAFDTGVVSDIKNMDAAIAAFKLKYGVEPPSSFILYEVAGDQMMQTGWWTDDDITRNSRAFIRQIWPDFDFSY